MLKLFISSENDAHVVIFDFHKGVKHPFIPIREVGNCFSQLPKEVMKMKGIIVGASLISEQHCEAYLINDIEIYGICDKKVETAEKMAEKYVCRNFLFLPKMTHMSSFSITIKGLSTPLPP